MLILLETVQFERELEASETSRDFLEIEIEKLERSCRI